MKKLFIIALSLFYSAALLAQSRAVGIVTQVKGEAKILEPGAKTARAVEPADLITEGTRITVATGGAVSYLFCPESVAAEASAGADVTFGAKIVTWNKGTQGAKRNVPYCRIPVMDAPQSASGARAATSEHLGGTGVRGGESSIVLLAPVRSHEQYKKTCLLWYPVTDANSYSVQLKSDDGKVILDGTSSGPRFLIPENIHLEPNTLYRWRVTALHDEEVLGDASTWFQTLTIENQTKLETTLAAIGTDVNSNDGRFRDLTSASAESLEGLYSTHGHDERESFDPTRQLIIASLYEELDMPIRAAAEYLPLRPFYKSNSWIKTKTQALNLKKSK